jgi:anti-sigma B factor antagonist
VDLELRTQGDVKVIKLRGRLSLGNAVDQLRGTFEDLVASGDHSVILDLSEVPMVDSSGIGLLVKTLTSFKQRGGSLKLLSPSKFTMQSFKLVGLLTLFEIYENLPAAVASFQS